MPLSQNPILIAQWSGSAADRAYAAGIVKVALAGAPSVRAAAAELRVGFRTLYSWIHTHPELIDYRARLRQRKTRI